MSNPVNNEHYKSMSKKELIRNLDAVSELYLVMARNLQTAAQEYARLYAQLVAVMHVAGGSITIHPDDLAALPDDLGEVDITNEAADPDDEESLARVWAIDYEAVDTDEEE